MDFLTRLSEFSSVIDRALENFLPPEDAFPPVIHQAMRYSVFTGGKRLRPVLTMATAQAVGGNHQQVIPVACAVELIHTYSLIHDDLPAMDNDDFRRGKPTNHRVYGEAVAILAGDALLTLAFDLIARCTRVSPEKIVKVIAEIAAAAGPGGLIGGQVVDISSTGETIDASTLEYIHRHKTGALYRAAVRAGAIMADAGEEELLALTRYGESLGLAFQIQDDILNVEGKEDRLGKPVGSDKKCNKATYPALFGLESAREKADLAVKAALAAIERFDQRADFLRQLAIFVIRRDY